MESVAGIIKEEWLCANLHVKNLHVNMPKSASAKRKKLKTIGKPNNDELSDCNVELKGHNWKKGKPFQ